MVKHLPLLFSPQNHPLMQALCAKLPAEQGKLLIRRFPDGESYLKIDTDVRQRQCLVLADLSNPDSKFLPLMFLAATLKELGASAVGLVAPYLSYMRQDIRFHEGEAVTSKIFASLISEKFDWLVTVDPHLHRYHSLDEIYSIPRRVVQGAPVLAEWLAGIENVLLVGPDAESEQWVSKIAALGEHPFVVGEKTRHGDRNVSITLPDISAFTGKKAVIIDDVVSSGHTVLECLGALQRAGFTTVDCACVHGIFTDGIDQVLRDKGIRKLVSCNTVVHPSNALDVSALLVTPINVFLEEAD